MLAADEPLSLQAHPSREQAEEGFARENEAGIALQAANRNYKDDNHKPELIVALSDFYAMAGFRPLAQTRELFAALECPELERYLAMLDDDPAESSESANLRVLFTTWITIPSAKRKELIDEYELHLANPYIAAERGYIDTVITPSNTRMNVSKALRALKTKRASLPAKKHGNIPL